MWERAGVRQNQIDALVEVKEQAKGQCDQMATAKAQKEIGQLRAANVQLQQDNDRLRQELAAARAAPRPSQPSSVSSGSSTHSGLADQERVKQLTANNNRIRGEREVLRKDNEKLKRVIVDWKASAHKEKERHDAMMDRLLASLQETKEKLKQVQQPSSGLPTHREMGGHLPCLPAAEGRPSIPTTLGGMQGHPTLSPYVSQTAHLSATDSPQVPQLTPQLTASATSQGPFDPEGAMESDSPAGLVSEKQ